MQSRNAGAKVLIGFDPPDQDILKAMSVIRIWGGHRESDWNSYWRTSELLILRPQLAETLETYGVTEVDIWPALRPRAPLSLDEFEVFVPNSPSDAPLVCREIEELTGRRARPMAAASGDAFRALMAERLLYLRQRFEPWDEGLPRYILGVDFDSGRHVRMRPAEPEKWRLVDHLVGGWYEERRVLPSMLLDPSEKGAELLSELKKEFYDWYSKGFRGHPPLNEIFQYRQVLERYGVDCNESYRFHLDDGWFPIDMERDRDWNAVRELCATPLPDAAGDLLRDENNQPVKPYGANYFFVALTDYSGG